jgi:hypothetical protein
MTVADYIDEWAKGLPSTGLQPSTIESYIRNPSVHVRPRIGGTKLRDLTPAKVRAFEAELSLDGARRDDKDGKLSPRTVGYVMTIIGKLLADAVEDGKLARNPATAAKKRKRGQGAARREMVTWSGAEFAHFLEGSPKMTGTARRGCSSEPRAAAVVWSSGSAGATSTSTADGA